MDRVYIETSVVSFATARPSRDSVVAVLQQQARRWWDEIRPHYRIVTSQFVIDEAAMGDRDAAKRRLSLLDSIPLIVPGDETERIADKILAQSLMPSSAKLDALHVATAAVAGVEYLLTLNCRHIANAHILPAVYDLLDREGVRRPLICTPSEFLGDPEGERSFDP